MSSTEVRGGGFLCQAGVVVGAPFAGVGGYQRGAALALDLEMEAGGVYTVPGDLNWLAGSEGSQVKVPFLSFFQDYERSASSLHFFNTEEGFLSGVGLIGSPTARACAQQVGMKCRTGSRLKSPGLQLFRRGFPSRWKAESRV